MAILFAVVARGSTVLAKHACFSGNFLEVTEQILARIPSENNKLTYSHGSYLFHYICHERIVYLCITDDVSICARAVCVRLRSRSELSCVVVVPAVLPFSSCAVSLSARVPSVSSSEVKKRFPDHATARELQNRAALRHEHIAERVRVELQGRGDVHVLRCYHQKHHSDPKGSDRLTETQMHVDDLKGIMVRNIDLVAQRGERLELLIDKTENLVDSSVTFKTTSRNLAHAMCMKNLKLTVIVVIVVLVLLYFIMTAACGGLSWPNCRKQ
ncbi:hypothetical protein cypCar_00042913 [Cyprinus carpio]|nr:hypothetical protein cypCar_00042913 [Cyprinus carpio]